MRKEHESLVIFFGENSFGWVGRAKSWISKTPTPRRRGARAQQSALQQRARRGVERRRAEGRRVRAPTPCTRAARAGATAVDPKPTAARATHARSLCEQRPRRRGRRPGFRKSLQRESGRTEKRSRRSRRRNRRTMRGGTRGGPGETAGFVSPPSVGGGRRVRGGAPRTRAFGTSGTASALVAEATLAAAPETTPTPGTRAPRCAAPPPPPPTRRSRRAESRRRRARAAAARNLTRNRCVCGSRRSACAGRTRWACGHAALQGAGSVGTDIEIYWPLDEVHYVARVTSYDPAELQHMVTYEADGVREFLCLWKEDVKVLDGTEERHAKSADTRRQRRAPRTPSPAKRRRRRRRRAAAPAARARPRGWTPPPSRARTPTRRCLWAYSEFFRARERRREELL